MRFTRSFVFAALLLTGCARTSGHEFAIPIETQVAVGQTTVADVRATFGEPDTSESFTTTGGAAAPKDPESEFDSATATVPGVYETLRYRFVKGPVLGGDIFVKTAIFLFRDGVLIGYNATSNFADHSTDFDETKISLLRKGESTREDAESILGPPTGKAIYPVALKAGQYKLLYNYGTSDLQTLKALHKELTLLFGTDGRLLDYRAKTTVSNVPVLRGPVRAFVPVYK